jgi:signal recognition particle receptor subunit alpha
VATDIHSLTFSQQLKMLDTFEILTTSGVVLWSKSYTPISPSIINGLITNVFIEERTLPGAGIADDISAANNPPYKHEQHTLKWTTVKELGLIFVVSWNPAEAQSTLTMNGIC